MTEGNKLVLKIVITGLMKVQFPLPLWEARPDRYGCGLGEGNKFGNEITNEKATITCQNMCCMWQALYMAKEVGKSLEPGKILQ